MSDFTKPDFDIRLLKDADDFIRSLDAETKKHIYLKLRKAQFENDPRKFSKVRGEIWEFRIPFKKIAYRFYAFWCKKNNSLVVATHGVKKKQNKASKNDIEKAERIMIKYYETYY